MFFSFVKSFSLYRANFDLTKYTRQENYKRKFDLPYVLSPIGCRHFQPLLSLCDISSVSTDEFTPEGGSDACRLATTSVSTGEFTPEKGNNMFFHTSKEESDVCRFAVTSALSPIVGFAATSPEGGSDSCRFATTPVSTEKFTPEGGSDVCLCNNTRFYGGIFPRKRK